MVTVCFIEGCKECRIFVHNDLPASPDGLPDEHAEWLLEIDSKVKNKMPVF